MNKVKIYEKGIDANRNLIALIMIGLSLMAITLIAYVYIQANREDPESSLFVFNALLPLFATWIGTVLAYYFGKENFEAASNRYQEIINKLSPEVLDDVSVNQIMITRKTMVVKQYEDIKGGKVVDLIAFLTEVDKSRLPIIDGEEIKYVAHKSLLLDAKERSQNAELTFEEFETGNKEMLEGFLEVDENTILEEVLAQLKLKPKFQDVFVNNKDKKVVGWITNTLIMDYLKTK